MDSPLELVLFAHSGGGQGYPGQGSFDLVSCLRQELVGKYEITYPIIEDPEAPTYEMWQRLFSQEFNKLHKPKILVGHSLGGSMLLKYLSEEKPNVDISALFLIAIPHWGETGWEVDDFKMNTDLGGELSHITKIFFYHSHDDFIVPFTHLEFYKSAFPNAIIRVLKGNDHAFAKGVPELVSDIRSLNSRQ